MSEHTMYMECDCEECLRIERESYTPPTHVSLHDCARIGCTRLTEEQECDIHAAEQGVVYEAKEPRPVPTLSEFLVLLGDHEGFSHRFWAKDAIYVAGGSDGVDRRVVQPLATPGGGE